MSPKAQRIAIAESCGLICFPMNGRWHDLTERADGTPVHIPDYLSDLNAMHEAEKTLEDNWYTYLTHLKKIAIRKERGVSSPAETIMDLLHATPAQRARNLWDDSK